MSTGPMQRGYTLVEVLVAMALLSVLSILVASGLYTVLQHYEHNRQHIAQLNALLVAQTMLDHDMWQLADRPVVDETSKTQPAVLSPDAHRLFFTTRNSQPSPANKHSDFTRVAYEFKQHTLYRKSWKVLDSVAPSTYPNESTSDVSTNPRVKTIMLDPLEGFSVRFLAHNEYKVGWPQSSKQQLPPAIEFTFDLGKQGKLRRVFVMGGQDAHA